MNAISPLISASWLFENAHKPELIILDASLKNPVKGDQSPADKIIPNALKLDWDKFSDLSHPLPHTLPSAAQFTQAAQELGINKNSLVIVYDRAGIYASPRVWFMFLAMGFKNCFILDGGLPEWLNMNYPCSTNYTEPRLKGNFVANFNTKLIASQQQVFDALHDKNKVIIDARNSDRFYGKTAEPRVGLRLGHIPNSINIPFEEVLFEHKMRTTAELEKVFSIIKAKNTPLIFSCGSGVTACIDALAAILIGYENISVYDGSWSEWGQVSDYPVA